jgi:uncharacterized protein
MTRGLHALWVLSIAYLALVFLVYVFQERLTYFPTRSLTATPAALSISYEDVELITEDGVRLHGWFVPTSRAHGTVLHLHGNGGNISHRLERIAQFHRLGFNVFLFDYRGYGRSDGRPNQEGTYIDALAAWRHLVSDRKLPRGSIVLHGESLGGAVASWLATQERPAALVIESSFTSARDLGAEVYPWLPIKWLIRNPYPSLQHLTQVDAPVLIVHSRDDEIIPFHHGQALFAAARGPKQFLEIRGGHNDGFLVSGRSYLQGLDAFLRSVPFPPVAPDARPVRRSSRRI